MNLEFLYGSNETGILIRKTTIQLRLKSTVLSGNRNLVVARNIENFEEKNDSIFFSGDEFTGGIFIKKIQHDLSGETCKIYRAILEKTNGNRLYRTWNYIPGIHGMSRKISVYEYFNKGRYEAFSPYLKESQHFKPPASTGIDIMGDYLVIVFIATKNHVEYFSNPLQSDPFVYPEEYGKLPPCFSRASYLLLYGKKVVFVSGTASIRGSETVHIDDEQRQIDTTVENIRIMLQQAIPGFIDFESEPYVYDKVIYIRKRDRINHIINYLSKNYPSFADGIFLEADICRKELDIEICLTAKQR